MRRSHRHQSPAMQWTRKHLPKLLAALIGGAALAGGAYLTTRQSPEDHLKSGIDLQQKGDLKGAAIELKNALQQLPSNADARYRLGQIHFTSNDFESAEKELKKARELGIQDAELDPLYARTLLLIDQPQRLIDEVQVPESAEAGLRATLLALRARAHLALKDQTASEKTLAEAEAISADHPEVLVARAFFAFADKKPAEALAKVEQALAKAPKRADFWLLKADLLHATKQREPALQAYSHALEIEPDNIAGLRARAQTYLEASNPEKAEVDIKRLLKLAPKDVMGRYFQAFIDFGQSRFTEANNTLQGVLRGAPNFLPGHLLAGGANIALGNSEAARFHLDKVLSAAPQHPLARKLMALTLAQLGNLEKAQQVLATFGESSDDSPVNALHGRIALQMGDYAAAKKHLERVSASAMQDPQYFTDLAASRMGSGDEAGALQALNKAAELDTTSAHPDVLLVLTYMKEKRSAEAMKVVDKLEKERPNDPLIHNLRGAIHLMQNDATNARSSFTKALQVKPSYFPATSNLALLDMQAKDVKSARARFQQLLKHNPKESRAWLALALLDLREKNEAGYLQNLEQAKKADDKQVQPHLLLTRYWLGKRDAGKALVEARSGLETTGRSDFNEYIGLALLMQGDNASALVTFAKWAENNPKNPLAHFRLAQAQLTAKDDASALKSLDKALALQPTYMEADLTKALLLSRMGRNEEGLKIARTWQTKAPKAPGGFLAEAEILFNNKAYLDAGKRFAKGAQIANQSVLLGRAYQAYVLAGQASEGEKLLSEWLVSHPSDGLVRHQLALAQLNAKRLKESAENYRILTRANPKDLIAYNNLAWILGELRDKDAITIAEQAHRLQPDSPVTQDTLGWILVNMGQVQKGLGFLTKAHEKDPAAADIHWHFAAALAKSGDRARAKQELEKLIYSGSNFAQKAEAKQLMDSIQ